MSFLKRLLKRETRSAIKSDDPYLAEWFGSRGGFAGYVDMSADTIKAVTGHNNLSTVTIYKNAANQAVLADRGIQALTSIVGERTLSNRENKLDRKAVK